MILKLIEKNIGDIIVGKALFIEYVFNKCDFLRAFVLVF